MKLSSPLFSDGGAIPRKYTCDGEDSVPPLAFEQVPPNAEGLALIVDDPDAPGGTWDHWILYDIPPSAKGIEEGREPAFSHGINSWKREKWGGPCPPDREHTYVFTLYAVDNVFRFSEAPRKKEVLHAIEGHVIEKAVLRAKYKRPWM